MNLKEYIEARHLEFDMSMEQCYELFSSKTRYTRMVNRPAIASLTEILRLADRLDVKPLTLIKKFKMGRNSLTPEILNLLKSSHHSCSIPCTQTQSTQIETSTPELVTR